MKLVDQKKLRGGSKIKLYEYMGKELFQRYGIPVPWGKVVETPEQAREAVKEIGPSVIKSQVLAGRRGKVGGIRFPENAAEAEEVAKTLLQQKLKGLEVTKLLVEEKLSITAELYLAITVDAAEKKIIILASAEGGMDIEEVDEDKIFKWPLDSCMGFSPFMGREIARHLKLKNKEGRNLVEVLKKLHQAFMEVDAELLEINPLVLSEDKLFAADAKVTLDDDALFRQTEQVIISQGTALEQEAEKIGLSFVELDGDIAVMANGAGITMATLDTIKFYGGEPANFLDAGGGANVEKTAKAIKILLDTKPEAIFINIFGGITRCDDVARAFIEVKEKYDINIPVVLRVVGTNEDKAVKILRENGISAYGDMQVAVKKVVQLAKGGEH